MSYPANPPEGIGQPSGMPMPRQVNDLTYTYFLLSYSGFSSNHVNLSPFYFFSVLGFSILFSDSDSS